jgi:RNA polymerase sigma-70 factor (ECF subfamily)
MQALRNTFMTQRRTAARRPRTGTQTLEDIELPDHRTAERPEEALQAQEVIATIAGLAENQRLALVAVDILGLSYREAANALGTREATIATRVFRAREHVVRELDDGHSPVAAESASAPAAPSRASHVLEPRDAARRGKVGDAGGVFSSEVSYES